MRELAAMHVHTAPLRATLERRHRLAGIEDARGIERGLHRVKGGDFRRAELHAHLAQLLDADSMLPGVRAADGDAMLEDAPAKLLGVLQVPGLRRIVEDARV